MTFTNEHDEAKGKRHSPPSLMPEFAIVATMLLIAAPVVLVGSVMLMAAKKGLSTRKAQRLIARTPRSSSQPG